MSLDLSMFWVLLIFQSADPWQQPKLGEVAPDIPLQAIVEGELPPGATLNSLQGKPMVLEFWASWCGPCIQAIPHTNSLVETFGDRIHFLFLSSEPKEIIARTVAAKKMKGVHVKVPENVFQTFGARSIPHTLLLDGQGRIVAVTRPEDVTHERLEAFLAGTSVVFPAETYEPARLMEENPDGHESLLGKVEFARDTRDGTQMRVMKPGHVVFAGASASVLLQEAFQLPNDRIHWKTPKLTDRFRVTVIAPNGENARAMEMLAQLLPMMLEIQVEKTRQERDVYVLQRDPQLDFSLRHSEKPHKLIAKGNALSLEGGNLSDLALALEDFAVHTSVLDETQIQGQYDVELSWVIGDLSSLQGALAKLGLTLNRAPRHIEVLEITAAP